MVEYDSRKILIYLAVKYDGDPFKIINAVRNREDENVPYKKIEKVCDNLKCKAITYLDKEFPESLKKMFRPPLVLFYYGDISLLNDDMKRYSVVGSRECSEYSKMATEKIIDEIGTGKVLVSGLANGIDTVAHKKALSNGIKTIAVLPSGIDYCYPANNRALYNKIKEEGLVISEFPGISEAEKEHFPMRNRLIVALSEVLIVPQINSHVSGTTITVNLAVGNNKPVYIVPQPIFEKTVNNEIIQEGANVIENGRTVLEDLKWD